MTATLSLLLTDATTYTSMCRPIPSGSRYLSQPCLWCGGSIIAGDDVFHIARTVFAHGECVATRGSRMSRLHPFQPVQRPS